MEVNPVQVLPGKFFEGKGDFLFREDVLHDRVDAVQAGQPGLEGGARFLVRPGPGHGGDVRFFLRRGVKKGRTGYQCGCRNARHEKLGDNHLSLLWCFLPHVQNLNVPSVSRTSLKLVRREAS